MSSSTLIIGEDGNVTVRFTIAAGETSPVASIPAGFSEFTVQAVGDFGSGGTATIQGANTNVSGDFSNLTDNAANAISLADNTVYNITPPAFLRAVADANVVDIDVVVHGIGRRT